jgi:hypothetical protein
VHADANCASNRNTDTYAYSNTYDHAQRHPNSHKCGYSYDYTYRYTNSYSYGYGQANPHRAAQRNTEATSHSAAAPESVIGDQLSDITSQKSIVSPRTRRAVIG